MSKNNQQIIAPPLPPRSLGDRMKRRVRAVAFGAIGSRQYASVGLSAFVDRPFMVVGHRLISLGAGVQIWPMARIEALGEGSDVIMSVGSGTVIQPFVHLAAVVGLSIGEECLFASHVYISDHDHYSGNPHVPVRRSRSLITAPVTIGNGVWLGERVCVLKGVTIGDGAIVGAASVVTRDIPPRSIAVGAPARVVKVWNETSGVWERT